jgi:hypothetical protein
VRFDAFKSAGRYRTAEDKFVKKESIRKFEGTLVDDEKALERDYI